MSVDDGALNVPPVSLDVLLRLANVHVCSNVHDQMARHCINPKNDWHAFSDSISGTWLQPH
jgi:hypothetical protein